MLAEARKSSERERAEQAAKEWLAERRRANPLPDIELPYLPLQRLYAGFWRLQGDRSVIAGAMGSAVGAIPYLAKSQWLRDSGFRPSTDEWCKAERLLDRLDQEYGRYMADRMKPDEVVEPKATQGED